MWWIIFLFAIGVTNGHWPSYKFSDWSYTCENNRCVKVVPNDGEIPRCHEECLMLCGDRKPQTLWPYPSNVSCYSEFLEPVNIDDLKVELKGFQINTKVYDYQTIMMNRFRKIVKNKAYGEVAKIKCKGKIIISIVDYNPKFIFNVTDEKYSLSTTYVDDEYGWNIKIQAQNYFGARHGLETLSQLIVFDDIRRRYVLPSTIMINDEPVFKYRSLLLDSAQHYIDVESIKRTLDGMAMSKLNVFHWRLSGPQSFPLILPSHPELAHYGAYSRRKVYTPAQIRKIVRYAKIRGITIIPEIDAPGQNGEGWQFSGLQSCFNTENVAAYQRPSGYLKMKMNETYDILQDIYKDLIDLFEIDSIFSIGGHEVNKYKCNDLGSNSDITKYQVKLVNIVQSLSGNKLKVLIWSRSDTFLYDTLNKSTIIGFASRIENNEIYSKLTNNYNVIVGRPELYSLDLYDWRHIYDKTDLPDYHKRYPWQILGGCAKLMKNADGLSMDHYIWPGASALAERLWCNPTTKAADAEPRMSVHRWSLIQNGIGCQTKETEYCERYLCPNEKL